MIIANLVNHFARKANLHHDMVAKQLCQNILDRIHLQDADASISSVSRRDLDDATLVRVKTTPGTSEGVLASLRRALPLATVTLVENLLTGRSETQVLLPSPDDQVELAKRLAHDKRGQATLRTILRLLLAMLFTSCVVCIVR